MVNIQRLAGQMKKPSRRPFVDLTSAKRNPPTATFVRDVRFSEQPLYIAGIEMQILRELIGRQCAIRHEVEVIRVIGIWEERAWIT